MPRERTVRRGDRRMMQVSTTSSPPASLSQATGALLQTNSEHNMIDKNFLSRIAMMETQIFSLQREIRSMKNKCTAGSPLEIALSGAYDDPFATVERVKHLASGSKSVDEVLFRIAKLCINGPIGQIGHRRALRVVALLLLDFLINESDYTPAYCLKGEALLPWFLYGQNVHNVPEVVLNEAYSLFSKASDNGSNEALFLRGRYLLTMELVHQDPSQALEGRKMVKRAATAKCPRAQLFLAHRYEYPQLDCTISFANDLPKGKGQRQKYILDLYRKAAESGEPDALNDLGTSYAEGYGGLTCDFDIAINYYKRALEKGSIHAFDNLGTHYETGMGNRFPERVDLRKAIYYYRQGVRRRCPKCAYNLGTAYEEGMGDVLLRNPDRAEAYYRYAIRLADDLNDAATAAKVLKDLIAIYITRIKLLPPDHADCKRFIRKLNSYGVSEEIVAKQMKIVNAAIAMALRDKPLSLSKLIGDVNTAVLVDHTRQLREKVRKEGKEKDKQFLNHILGQDEDEERRVADTPNKRKGNARSNRATAKRRKR